MSMSGSIFKRPRPRTPRTTPTPAEQQNTARQRNTMSDVAFGPGLSFPEPPSMEAPIGHNAPTVKECNCPICRGRRDAQAGIKPPPPPPPPEQKFKVGDEVKYVRGSYGDSERNPLWNGICGRIGGKIKMMERCSAPEHYVAYVNWEHGRSTTYYQSVLEILTEEDKKRLTYKKREPIDVKKLGVAKIKVRMHKRLGHELRIYLNTGGAYPICYMIGKNKEGVIAKGILLNRTGGCSQMPKLDSATLSKAMVLLTKKKFTPCGLIRIGKFSSANEERGFSLQEVGWMGEGGMIISFSPDWVRVEVYCPVTHQTHQLPYAVVK